MALVRAVEWAVRNPTAFAAVYSGIQAGAAWVGYKYTKYQIENIKKVAAMVGPGRKFYWGTGAPLKKKTAPPWRGAPRRAPPPVLDSNMAPNSNVHGALVTLGNSNNRISYQRSKVGRKKYRPKTPSAVLSQYRWQSIVADPSYTIDRAMPLHIQTGLATCPDGVQRTCLAMPVYCFNLSALAENGKQLGVNVYDYVTCPMYRLYKNTNAPADANLSPTTQNYFWVNISGVGNSPVGTASNYQWNREICDDVVGPTGSYRHLWSHVQMMIDTDRPDEQTRVHVDLVRFKNEHCAPQRVFFDTTSNSFKTYDMSLNATGEETSALDVFWESFLTHRLIHPLLDYNIPDKEKQWRVIKGHQIEMGNVTTGSFRRHNLDLFYHNGAKYDLVDNQTGDTVVPADATDWNNDMVQGNLNQTDLAGSFKPRFNQLTKSRKYEMYSRDRKTDVWMMIYSDSHPIYLTEGYPANIHFDIKVKNKYETEPNKGYKLGVTVGGTTYEVK